MGRLTLNVLLSFAQFEREVIGERVRDKIAASKRKGLWVGGPVPLGYRCVDKKLVVVPSEAETVRTIFTRYLELGSLSALVTALDRRGIRTKVNGRGDSRARGGIRFGVGSLAHLLKNRFYIGEVVYRGEAYRGEHEAILERTLFEAVQAKLAANTVARQVQIKGSPAILTGRIFDDRGNRMSPTHSNKRGVRYRYYVSHMLLQNRKSEAGSVPRVPAPEIEALVLNGVRKHLASTAELPTADRDLIDHYVERVIIRSQAVEVSIASLEAGHANEGWAQAETSASGDRATDLPRTATIKLPWSAPSYVVIKGIVHAPSTTAKMNPQRGEALLNAMAKARRWVEDLRLGRANSFAEIAERESLGERHIRLLAPLAFVSPRIIAAIVEGTASADLTVSSLARALQYSWAAQEQSIGLHVA
jgi:hypothetical protein